MMENNQGFSFLHLLSPTTTDKQVMKIPMDRKSSFESNISPAQPPMPPPDGSKDAIDALCSSGEQTYAQFMNNFITLTPADINPQAKVKVIKPSLPRLRNIASIKKPAHVGLDSYSEPAIPSSETVAAHTNNEIEEEVLDEGTKVADVLLRKSKAAVKVDNFIDDIDDDDDEIECDYSASFVDEPMQKEPTIQQPHASLRTDEIFSRIQAKKRANEENLLDMIDAESDPESMSGDEGFEPDFYPEQNDSLSVSENDTDLTYDVKQDLPNPGEIEDSVESEPSTKVHETELQFTSSASVLVPQHETENAATNEVEDFKLDEDFDYDHVTLSQKYPPEMRAMMPGHMGTGMK